MLLNSFWQRKYSLWFLGGGLTAIGDLFFKKATSHSLFDCQIIISTDSHLLLLQEAKEHERIGSVHCFASLGINLEVHTL